MVYMSMILTKVNVLFAPASDFQPDELLPLMEGAETMAEAADRLGFDDVVAEPWRDRLREFLRSIPPSIDAAGMAAVRSALRRGVRVTVTWMPDYAFGLRVWEVSRLDGTEWVGMVNVQINSQDPELDPPAPSA